MSQRLKTQTATLEVEDNVGSPETWVMVGGVRTMNDLMSGTAAEIDTTDLSSLAKEFEYGLVDNGSMTSEVFRDPNDPGQILLKNLRVSTARNRFRVTHVNPLAGSPDRTSYVFDGFVTTFPLSIAVDDVIRSTLTIRLSGQVVES